MISIFNELLTFRALATTAVMTLLLGFLILTMRRHVRSVDLTAYFGLVILVDFSFFLALLARGTTLVSDAQEWHRLAAHAATYLLGDSTVATSYVAGKEGYIWILGSLYALGGNAPVLAIVLNVVARVVTLFAVAKSTEVMCLRGGIAPEHTRTAVRAAATLCALLPSFFIWSPQVLRESLTIMCVALAAAAAFIGVVRNQALLTMLAMAPVALLVWVRASLGLSVGVAVLLALIYTWLGSAKYSRELRILYAAGVALSLPISLAWLTATIGLSSERIVASTAELSETASSGFPGLSWDATLPQVLAATVPRVLIGPFPWEWRPTGVMILAIIEWACWVLVLFLAWRGMRNARPGEPLRGVAWMIPFFVALTAAIMIGLCLTVANYGLLARFRPMGVIGLIPVAALGWVRLRAAVTPTRPGGPRQRPLPRRFASRALTHQGRPVTAANPRSGSPRRQIETRPAPEDRLTHNAVHHL